MIAIYPWTMILFIRLSCASLLFHIVFCLNGNNHFRASDIMGSFKTVIKVIFKAIKHLACVAFVVEITLTVILHR